MDTINDIISIITNVIAINNSANNIALNNLLKFLIYKFII